ncbi:MAG: hypothetical protein MH204_10750 [Fimbriimonadaceae bacterium]|nr:hypothetical protein [Fimbriimonadaceae bacterium]
MSKHTVLCEDALHKSICASFLNEKGLKDLARRQVDIRALGSRNQVIAEAARLAPKVLGAKARRFLIIAVDQHDPNLPVDASRREIIRILGSEVSLELDRLLVIEFRREAENWIHALDNLGADESARYHKADKEGRELGVALAAGRNLATELPSVQAARAAWTVFKNLHGL